jgi:hypothetical protein
MQEDMHTSLVMRKLKLVKVKMKKIMKNLLAMLNKNLAIKLFPQKSPDK